MKVSYKKLFNILKNRGITKTTLGNALDLSSTTLAKLAKDEQISMNTLIGICNYLNCQPGDIMEVRYEIDKDTLLYRLTEDQTRYIYETNTIGFDKEPVNIDDIMETINHFQCFDYMIECANNTLDEEFIKNVHKILKTNTSDSRISWFNVGEYKSRRNMVGDMKTVPPEKVKDEMNKLLEEYWKKQNITLEDILDVHVRFERIHPFQDGNGRVGRIIIFKECLKHNIVPFIIEDNLKFFYYRGLKEWDNEKGYLMDICLTAQDRYKAYLDYFEIKYEKYV